MSKIANFPTKKTRRGLVPDSVSSNSALGNAFMALAKETEITRVSLQQLTLCAPDPAFPGALPIVTYGETEQQLRRLVAHFGFPRLPFTNEELQGLLNYCKTLTESKGGLLAMPPKEQPLWREVTVDVTQQYFPVFAEGLEPFFDDDFDALKQLHTEAFYARLADWWVVYEKQEYDD